MSTFGFSEPAVQGGDSAKAGRFAGRLWLIVGIAILAVGLGMALLGAG